MVTVYFKDIITMDSLKRIILPDSLEGKSVLIAGAAGFLPSYVAEYYLDLGATVIGLDNFITGSR